MITSLDTSRTDGRTPPPGKKRRAAWLLCSVAILAAACGTEASANEAGGGGTASSDTSVTSTTEQALQDEGLPSLSVDESDAAPDEDAEAERTENEDGEADESSDPNEQAALEDFFACMRDEGIDPDEIDNASPADAEALTSTPEFLAASSVCEPILAEAFGTFELDAETEAALADRSADMAACGREVLGVEIPDNILLLPEDHPTWMELDALETTPAQDAAIEQCFEDILGDILDDEGNLIIAGEEE